MAKKIALITGSSRGIGAACAKQFAKNGYAVCINYHNDQVAAEKIATEIQQLGVQSIVQQADVSDEKQVIALFQAIEQKLGIITTLVNNAAILFKQMPLTQMSVERINKTLITNITSYFLCSKEAVLRMSSENGGNGGTIVNISSGVVKTGGANTYIDYAASKGAIDVFTKGLALEVVGQKIRVNGVRPGLIYTEIHASGGEPNKVNNRKNKIPLKRGGTPEEVAKAVYWLACEKSSYTTGNFIDVTGGL